MEIPTEKKALKMKVAELYDTHLEALMALSKFIELHDREISGDETITQKEWNTAIKNGKKVLEK